jgi:uncharacterized protein (TIGR03086 family)
MDVLATYSRIADHLDQLMQNCLPDRWSAPSPCTKWTARDAALHVVNNNLGLLGQPPSDAGDVAGAWREVSVDMKAALADPAALARKPGGPFGESTLEMLSGGLLLTDTLVHTWDFAQATGQDATLDAEALPHCFEWLRSLGDRIRRPGGFDAAIEPPPGADLQTAFICYTGRRA